MLPKPAEMGSVLICLFALCLFAVYGIGNSLKSRPFITASNISKPCFMLFTRYVSIFDYSIQDCLLRAACPSIAIHNQSPFILGPYRHRVKNLYRLTRVRRDVRCIGNRVFDAQSIVNFCNPRGSSPLISANQLHLGASFRDRVMANSLF